MRVRGARIVVAGWGVAMDTRRLLSSATRTTVDRRAGDEPMQTSRRVPPAYAFQPVASAPKSQARAFYLLVSLLFIYLPRRFFYPYSYRSRALVF